MTTKRRFKIQKLIIYFSVQWGLPCSTLHQSGIRRACKATCTAAYSPKSTERSDLSSGWPGVFSRMDTAWLILVSASFGWSTNFFNLHHYRSNYYSDVVIRCLWSCKQVYCVQGKGICRVCFKREKRITSKKETMLFQEMKQYFNSFAVIVFIAF